MALELYRKIGKGTVTSLTENFLSITSEVPLTAVDFEAISDEGFHLMFSPQTVAVGTIAGCFEYLYTFKWKSSCL